MFFSWLWVLYGGHSLFFLECVYLRLLYPSLIFDMFLWLSVCVCVCECVGGVWISVIFLVCVWLCVFGIFVNVWQCGFKFTGKFFLIAFVCIYIYIYIYMYVCVCVYIYMYIYIYIYMCVCVCVCLCFHLDAFIREAVWHKVYIMDI